MEDFFFTIEQIEQRAKAIRVIGKALGVTARMNIFREETLNRMRHNLIEAVHCIGVDCEKAENQLKTNPIKSKRP